MKKSILALLLASLLVFSLSACGSYSFSDGPPLIQPAASGVDTAIVLRGTVEEKQMHFGSVRVLSRPLTFDTYNFRFDDFFVLTGDRVYEGQLLARMDVDHILERIEEQEAYIAQMRRRHNIENERYSLEIDKLQLAYASTTNLAAETMDESLFAEAERIRSDIEWARLTKAQATVNQTRSMLKAEDDLREIRDALNGTDLIAPYDGVITYLMATPGMWVSEDDHILYIAGHQTVIVEYLGNSLQASDIRELVRIQAYINGRVYDLDFLDLTPAQLDYYANQSRAIGSPVFRLPIRFTIQAPDEYLPPLGSFVTIFMYTIFYEDVLRVPINAVSYDRQDGYSVILWKDGIQVHTPVEATTTRTFAAIFKGLEEGDVVIVR